MSGVMNCASVEAERCRSREAYKAFATVSVIFLFPGSLSPVLRALFLPSSFSLKGKVGEIMYFEVSQIMWPYFLNYVHFYQYYRKSSMLPSGMVYYYWDFWH